MLAPAAARSRRSMMSATASGASLSASHLDERAHDGSHHIAQKAVGAHLKIPQVGLDLHPSGYAQVADVGLDLGVQAC